MKTSLDELETTGLTPLPFTMWYEAKHVISTSVFSHVLNENTIIGPAYILSEEKNQIKWYGYVLLY